ncbi:MAG: hypothetical protein ICV68_17400 [Pyrinomonadaceae bacterium]|nr:hypothetical protein [Pyrinomonadaceae bacterium]
MRKRLASCLLVLTALAASPARSQEATALQRVQSLNNPSALNRIRVYYSPGHETRALELRGMIEDAMQFYERRLRVKEEISLAVLAPEQWRQVGLQVPYGVPNVSSPPRVIFLPATTDNATTEATLGLRSRASRATLKMVEASGFTYEEGASKSVDLIGLHELGHVYAAAYGIKSANRWLDEFLATYFAYAYLRQRRPKLARLWDAISNAYVDAVRPKHTALEDFERLYFGVGLDNYGWYQAKFLLKVAQIHQAKRLRFLEEVRDVFPQSERGQVSLGVVVERLEKIRPGFVEWSKGLK